MTTFNRRTAMLFCLALGACADAQVEPLVTTTAAPQARLAKPSRIVVHPFTVDPSRVALDSAPGNRAVRSVQGNDVQRRRTVANDTQKAFATALVAKLREKGLNAVSAASLGRSRDSRPQLLVQGEFTAIDEGNRARRAVLGFGAGASRVTGIANLAWKEGTTQPRVVQSFALEADSGAMPGAVVGAAGGVAMVAGGSAARGTIGEVRGSQDIANLAQTTADRIAEFAAAQGWR